MNALPRRTKGPIQMREDARGGGLSDDSRTERRRAHEPSPKLLRFPAVRERTGLSRSTIWRLERQGQFPQHHRISANAVAWVEEEVTSWIQARIGRIAV